MTTIEQVENDFLKMINELKKNQVVFTYDELSKIIFEANRSGVTEKSKVNYAKIEISRKILNRLIPLDKPEIRVRILLQYKLNDNFINDYIKLFEIMKKYIEPYHGYSFPKIKIWLKQNSKQFIDYMLEALEKDVESDTTEIPDIPEKSSKVTFHPQNKNKVLIDYSASSYPRIAIEDTVPPLVTWKAKMKLQKLDQQRRKLDQQRRK